MKIRIILLGVLLTNFLIGCEEDGFLDAKNVNSPDASDFIADRVSAEAAVFAIYGATQFSHITGGSAIGGFELMGVAGKEFHGNNGAGPEAALDQLSFTGTSDFEVVQFEQLYRMVDRANSAISGLENLPESKLSNKLKLPLVGEAHFLRGLAYFWLMSTYNKGSVPLVLKNAQSIIETQNNFNAPRKDVLKSIISDLKIAQSLLPNHNSLRKINFNGKEITINNWSEANTGRATWGAATSYLGKVLLYEERYDEATVEFKKVIESDQYRLAPNFVDNTNMEGEYNEESIFEIGFSNDLGLNEGNFGGGEGDNINETTSRGYIFNWLNGGYGICFTSNFITELLKSDLVDENNPINYADGDITNKDPENFTGYSKRCNATIAFKSDGEIFYNSILIEGNKKNEIVGTESNSQPRKFCNWTLPNEPAIAVSEINERLLRFADVYLMYSECLLSGSTPESEAINTSIKLINMIRKRAGVISLEELFAESRKYMQGPKNGSDIGVKNPKEFGVRALNKENILTHILDEERLVELALEGRGITWNDLRRRKDIVDRITELNNYEYNNWGIKQELEGIKLKISNDPEGAGYLPIPRIEEIGK